MDLTRPPHTYSLSGDKDLDLSLDCADIVCLLCKLDKSKSSKMYVIQGRRDFMAKFEAQLSSFIGQDEFVSLCEKFKTRSGRSYVCKQCFGLVNKTHRSIKKVQTGIARTLTRINSFIQGDDQLSDEEVSTTLQREKLLPVSERIVKKISSMTCLKINNKVPWILLKPVCTSTAISNDFTSGQCSDDHQISTVKTADFVKLISFDITNPLLLVKSPQPLNLADVKNNCVYVCGHNGCDWLFSSRYLWDNHLRHFHFNGKPFLCPFEDCDRSFSSQSKLELHQRLHTGERPFVCELCGKAFIGQQELLHHKWTHSEDKPFKCPRLGCHQKYKYRATLKRHLQHHDGYCPFPCNYPGCGKAFKNKYELKCHYRHHTGEKPIQCKEPGCGKSFRIPCEYTKHRRLEHTGERPFKCPVEGCTAVFATAGALNNHSLTHNTENKYCCELCGKTFKYKMSYVVHHRTHTEPAQYSCTVAGCHHSFHLHNLLQRHLVSAHGIQPKRTVRHRARKSKNLHHMVFLCPVKGCSKQYSEAQSMDHHVISKHGLHGYKATPVQRKKFFPCPVVNCGAQYITYSGLRYHKLTTHNIKGTIHVETKGIDSTFPTSSDQRDRRNMTTGKAMKDVVVTEHDNSQAQLRTVPNYNWRSSEKLPQPSQTTDPNFEGFLESQTTHALQNAPVIQPVNVDIIDSSEGLHVTTNQHTQLTELHSLDLSQALSTTSHHTIKSSKQFDVINSAFDKPHILQTSLNSNTPGLSLDLRSRFTSFVQPTSTSNQVQKGLSSHKATSSELNDNKKFSYISLKQQERQPTCPTTQPAILDPASVQLNSLNVVPLALTATLSSQQLLSNLNPSEIKQSPLPALPESVMPHESGHLPSHYLHRQKIPQAHSQSHSQNSTLPSYQLPPSSATSTLRMSAPTTVTLLHHPQPLATATTSMTQRDRSHVLPTRPPPPYGSHSVSSYRQTLPSSTSNETKRESV